MLRAWYEDKILGACSQCKGIPIIWIEQLWIIESMIKIAGSSVESRPLPLMLFCMHVQDIYMHIVCV